MIEKVYGLTMLEEKVVEKIVDDKNVAINHMILPKDASLPEHYSNSNVYMIVVKGKLTIQLGEAQSNIYEPGNILNIPFQTKMNVSNKHEDILEFFVVKAPNPRDMMK